MEWDPHNDLGQVGQVRQVYLNERKSLVRLLLKKEQLAPRNSIKNAFVTAHLQDELAPRNGKNKINEAHPQKQLAPRNYIKNVFAMAHLQDEFAPRELIRSKIPASR